MLAEMRRPIFQNTCYPKQTNVITVIVISED